MAAPEVKATDSWSALAMRHYGDALLGLRLAEANGADSRSKPIDCQGLHFPPVEELDPNRLSSGPGPDAAAMFDDDEQSVVAEARYRMVMAMGGSGAVNEAPSSVSHHKVEKKDRKTREQRIVEAKEKRVDLLESLGAADGQALVLDVKPTRRPDKNKKADKPTTKNDLAKKLAQSDGRKLVLDVKPGVKQRPGEGEDGEEVTLADAMAAVDGKAMITELRATRKKKKKKKKHHDDDDEENFKEDKRGERLGDKLAELDGKAMILDVRASTRRKKTKEQKEAKKKRKATQKLFDDLSERDGKELVLDLNIQVKDEAKLDRLKEKRRLAKKRKRRTGAGTLIPKDWKAEGRISADDVDDYLDELRGQREFEQDYFGDDTEAGTNPVAKAAKETHHRSQRTRRSQYTEKARQAAGKKRAETEGFGAFDAIHELPAGAASGQPKIKRQSDEADESQEAQKNKQESTNADANKGHVLDETFGEVLDDIEATDVGGQNDAALPTGPQPQARPLGQQAGQAPPVVAADSAADGAAARTRQKNKQPIKQQSTARKEHDAGQKRRTVPPGAAPGSEQKRSAAAAPRRSAQSPAPPAPPSRAHAGPQRGPRSEKAVPVKKKQQVQDWNAPPDPNALGSLNDWDDDDDNFSGLSGLSGLSGISKTGAAAGPLPPVSAQDPYAPEVMARLCMLSPGSVMQAARSAPVGAGPVLQLIGGLREAKDEASQADLMRKFIKGNGADAQQTLELLLTT